ncbi:bestrophin-like domain [Streptomyces tsukubensis]|uniref:bestrophin-like domain n=1 Tax=Streptomyces tsukubensis TaxID=83656 RepID=UPI0036C43332
MAAVIVTAVLALLAGLAANRRLRPRLTDRDDAAGLEIRDLVEPLITLTVLLLAFVLVTASSSYGKAETAARSEARALDHLAETAAYAPADRRAALHTQAICYARAVRAQEWPAMSDGEGSPAPGVWSTGFRQSLHGLQEGPVFALLVAADNKRSEERDERLTQATASIPATIFWFLLATLAVTVVALGSCLPRRDNRGHLLAVAAITALLAAALCIIRDVDRPFGGIISVSATAMAEVERQTVRDYRAHSPAGELPCDAEGNRTGS